MAKKGKPWEINQISSNSNTKNKQKKTAKRNSYVKAKVDKSKRSLCADRDKMINYMISKLLQME